MTSILPPASAQEKFIDQFDLDDPDYNLELKKDPEVKEDVKIMRERRRVSLVLKSQNFRSEIEKITASHMKNGHLSGNVKKLIQNMDYLTPHAKLGSSKFNRCATVPVIPINDLKSLDEREISKTEKFIRCKVASLYRLADIYRWNSSQTFAHVSSKIAKNTDEYLIRCNGIFYNQVTASSLLKVNLGGDILDNGSIPSSKLDFAGWMLHSSIYNVNPEIKCVIHLANTSTLAVSSLGKGLLPISQEAMILGPMALYDFETSANQTVEEELKSISKVIVSSGEACRLLSVKNNGILAFGHSIEETWMVAYHAMIACETQLKISCIPDDELVIPSEAAQKLSLHVGRNPNEVTQGGQAAAAGTKWKTGELEFEALMRVIDSAGYRSGHFYRLPQIKNSSQIISVEELLNSSSKDYAKNIRNNKKQRDDILVPPTTSSFSNTFYSKNGNLTSAERIKMKSKSLQRKHWLNTPNAYKKTEIEEIGTANPKTITMWREDFDNGTDFAHKGALSDGDDLFDSPTKKNDRVKTFKPRVSVKISPRTATLPPNMSLSRNATMSFTKPSVLTSGISEAIEDPNCFAPQGYNPREFKQKRSTVKEKYYKDIKDSGPKSKILDNIDDFEDTVDASSPITSPRGTMIRLDPKNPPKLESGHVVLVGAVSKAIIKDDVRHNVAAYQTIYNPNPFELTTDDDLERYKTNIARKAKGLLTLEEEEAREEVRKKMAEEKAAEEKARQEKLIEEQKSKKLEKTPGKSKKSPRKPASPKVISDSSDGEDRSDEKKGKKKRFKFPSLPKVATKTTKN